MRRWVALAAAVLVAFVPVVADPAVAESGSPDPVRALKQQFRTGHGVQVSEITRLLEGGKSIGRLRVRGTLQFGPSGPGAADFTWQEVPDPGQEQDGNREEFTRYHIVHVNGRFYYAINAYRGPVPEGKTWVRVDGSRGLGPLIAPTVSLQVINVYKPAVVKAMLKTSTGKPVSGGFLYQGSISYAELRKASKSTYADWFGGLSADELRKTRIAWRLWTDGRGLLKRLVTSQALGKGVSRTDTRYTAWRSHVVISAPPADQVIDENDLYEYIPEPTVTIDDLRARLSDS